MSSGSHIKLNLVEFIQVIDDVNTKVGLQERTSCIVPITAGREKTEGSKQDIRRAVVRITVAEQQNFLANYDP